MNHDEVVRSAATRRNFLKGAGIAGIGITSAAIIGSKFGGSEQKVEAAIEPAYTDVDILNFALNLEYLEAEFYAMSTWGTTLVRLGVIKDEDTSGPTTGGQMVPNFGAYSEATLATALRTDEIQHVVYLRAALGSYAVKKPAINLNALGYGFSSVDSWLKLARIFEDVGVSAYLGAAPLITSKAYLAAAGAILATEAQHSGSIRLSCIMNGVMSGPVDSMDVPPLTNKVYDTTMKGLCIPRTIPQVLSIVYGGGSCSGGFFPNGINGQVTCVS